MGLEISVAVEENRGAAVARLASGSILASMRSTGLPGASEATLFLRR